MLAMVFAALSIGVLALLQYVGLIDLFTAEGLAEAVFYIIAIIVFLYFTYVVTYGGLNSVERKKIVVIFLLVLGACSLLVWI